MGENEIKNDWEDKILDLCDCEESGNHFRCHYIESRSKKK